MKRIIIAVLVLLAGSAFAQGTKPPLSSQEPTDCKKISNPNKRLLCFDNQQKTRERSAEDETIRKAAEEDQKRKADEEQKYRAEEEQKQKKQAAFVSAARPSLNALRKLEARVGVGISYRDYYSPLGDIKFEINSFVKGKYGAHDEKFTKHLYQAMTEYEIAGMVWKSKFTGGSLSNYFYLSPELLTNYPKASEYAETAGNNRRIPIDRMLSIIWEKAGNETNNAENVLTMLSGNNPKTPSEPKSESK